MNPKVVILLSTYNGEDYLQEQLDSLFAQTYTHIEIIARDDGSQDNTLNILKQAPITLMQTQHNVGAKESFATLLTYALNETNADYFMFCDQDDVWHHNKVELTLNTMLKSNTNQPTLVHTNLVVADENLETIADSMWDYEHILPQHNSFNRILIQNTITGCTSMINRTLAQKALPIPPKAIMHDWWLGLVASQFGTILTLKTTTINYRQHHNNTIGAKQNKLTTLRELLGLAKSMIKRNSMYMKDMQINLDQAKAFLEVYKDQLKPNTIEMLQILIHFPTLSFLEKRKHLLKYKLYKQGFMRNLAHWIKL
jgi:glycosyltransferase involved in cell wall biosynthesis